MGEGQSLCIAHLGSYYAQVDIPDTCYTCVEFVMIVNLSQHIFFPIEFRSFDKKHHN